MTVSETFSALCRMARGMGLEQALKAARLPASRAHNAYPAVQLVEQMVASVLSGARTLSHVDSVELDPAIAEGFGWKQAAQHRAISRFFYRFSASDCQRFRLATLRWIVRRMPDMAVTADFEGSAETGCYAAIPTLRLLAGFEAPEDCARLREDVLGAVRSRTLGLVRVGGGYPDPVLIEELSKKRIPYIAEIQAEGPALCQLIRETIWAPLESGFEIGDWNDPEEDRIVAVRERLVDAGEQPLLPLFDDSDDYQGWDYRLLRTNLKLPAEQVRHLWAGRMRSLAVIEQIRTSFENPGYVLDNPVARRAAGYSAVLAYNLASLFCRRTPRSILVDFPEAAPLWLLELKSLRTP